MCALSRYTPQGYDKGTTVAGATEALDDEEEVRMVNLREARRAANLSQRDTAVRAGMSVGGYRKLEQGERGQPHYETALNIARALGVDPSEVEELAPTIKEAEAVADRLYEDRQFKRAVAREVKEQLSQMAMAQQRMILQVASQSINDVQVAAQGGDEEIT